MTARILFVALLCWPRVLYAQEPVVGWADKVSWVTAGVNMTWGAIEAARGDRPWCHLGQMAVSGGLAIGGALTLQHVIDSPRPCCPGNGMPSAHAAASWVGLAQPGRARGFSLRFTIGLGSAGATTILRPAAHRHTDKQAIWGSVLGAGSEAVSQLIPCGA